MYTALLLAQSDGGDVLAYLVGVPLAIAAFFLPSIIAFRRGHKYKHIVLGLNIFGFTGFFWLAAFVWAVWPADSSLADPIVGNPTGTGRRNLGDTVGSTGYGVLRGAVDEHVKSVGESPAADIVSKAAETGGRAVQGAAEMVQRSVENKHHADVLDQLARLAKLRDDGALTNDEFQALKARLLDRYAGPAGQ